MTLRPIAPHGIRVVKVSRDWRIGPAHVRIGNRVGFGERGVPSPHGVRGVIVGAVGEAGQVGRHGIQRESTYSYFVTSSNKGDKQGNVARFVPNQLPDPTSPSVTPPAGAGVAPSVAADH
jgi:hypothetical protein